MGAAEIRNARPGRGTSSLTVLIGCFALVAVSALEGCGEEKTGGPGDTPGNGTGGSSPGAATGGEDGRGNEGPGGDSSQDGTGGDSGAEEPATPLYAIATQHIDSNSEPTSYVILTESLKGELQISSAVIELPGRGIAGGAAGDGKLFVATDLSAELTRYDLGEDGKLEKVASISFLPQGVSNFSGYSAQFQFIDENKAYWFSRAAERIVIWDPEELIITGSIPLSGVNREGHVTTFTGAPIRQGNTLYSFVSWDVRGAPVTVPEVSALVIVDTVNDTAEIAIDERCGYARDGVIVGDWLYIATEAMAAAAHYLNDLNAGPPCLIRFNIETRTFDEDFKIELNPLAGALATGSLLVASSGKAFLHVLDHAAAEPLVPSPINNPRVLASADLWRTAELSLGDTPSLTLLDLPLSSASVLPFTLKDGLKVSTTFGAEKRIYEVTDSGLAGTDRVNGTVPGTVFSIVQLR